MQLTITRINYTDSLRNRIAKRLCTEICIECRTNLPDKKCDEKDDFCPLLDRLDELIRIVSITRDYSLEPYKENVREIICSACRQDSKRKCTLRDRYECALEEYFQKIVAILEKEFKADPAVS